MDKNLPRDISTVRNHLKALDDGPGATGDQTIRAKAAEHHLKMKSLREFRDGKDSAIDKTMITLWAKLIGADSTITMGDVLPDVGPSSDRQSREATRLARYDQYDIIEGTRPEADSALSVWADMVTTGAIGEDSRYGGAFEPHPIGKNASLSKTLGDIAYRLNRYVLPDHQKHMLTRDMAKYGSWFEQIGISKQEDGQYHISRLVPMDPRELRVLEEPTPDAAFGRFPPGYTEPVKEWPQWKIVHFANRMSRLDIYGRSIYQSILRSWVQVEAMEGGMITGRLERAPQRYKHTISLKGANSIEEKNQRIRAYKDANRKVRTVDGNRNYQNQRITPTAGEDIIIGKEEKDSPADVSILPGDAHLKDIDDFQHFFNKLLAGLGPPKLHLGYEQDTMRSVGTELTIVFARKARRMQMALIQGLNHLYWVELILQGIDPRKTKYMIFPPSLGTRDELVRAQIQETHAKTVFYLSKAMAATGTMPSINWFLKSVMHFDDESLPTVQDLVKVIQPGAGAGTAGDGTGSSSDGIGSAGDGPSMSTGELTNMNASLREKVPGLAGELKYLQWQLDERAIRRMDVEEIDKRGLMNFGDFMPSFDVHECAKHLGIRRTLREVSAAA